MLREGEVRYTSGTLPTKYTFTGQYSNVMDFGLMYYNARWYDPLLGRFSSADTLIPEPGNPQSWDRYSYTLNNPLKYTDSTGHWVDVALDVAFILYDINDIKTNGLTWVSGLSLAADVVGALLPVVTGAGLAVRAVSHADDAIKAVNVVDNAVDATKIIDNTIDLGNASDNLMDTLKATDNRPDLFRNAGPDKTPNLGLKTPDNPYRDGSWDIAPDVNGNAGPGGGGLSTESVIDPSWKNPWRYPGDAPIPDGIRVFQDAPLDNPSHWLWEPALKMPYNQYKQLLKQTIPYWQIIE